MYRMESLDEFLDDVSLETRDAPYPLILSAIRKAVREFCRDTWVWREDLPAVGIQADQEEYLLFLPRNSAVITFYKVQREGTDYLDYVELKIPETLVMLDEPAESYELEINAILRPTKDATQIPDFFHEYYDVPIKSLAKAILMAMPGKGWTNPNLSLYYRNIYNKEKASARIYEIKKRKPTSLRVKFRRFV